MKKGRTILWALCLFLVFAGIAYGDRYDGTLARIDLEKNCIEVSYRPGGPRDLLLAADVDRSTLASAHKAKIKVYVSMISKSVEINGKSFKARTVVHRD